MVLSDYGVAKCSTTVARTTARAPYAAYARSMVYPVRDMTGDGLPEVIIINQDGIAAHSYYMRSDEDYTVSVQINTGSHLSVLL
jgi:hypothetical protein